jgi:L-galactose dehydrogenase
LHDLGYYINRYIEQALDDGIRALQQLNSQGKIRFFGVTAYPIAVLKDVLAHVDVDTVLCHNHYTLSDTQLLELVPLAAEKQVGLIAARPGCSPPAARQRESSCSAHDTMPA